MWLSWLWAENRPFGTYVLTVVASSFSKLNTDFFQRILYWNSAKDNNLQLMCKFEANQCGFHNALKINLSELFSFWQPSLSFFKLNTNFFQKFLYTVGWGNFEQIFKFLLNFFRNIKTGSIKLTVHNICIFIFQKNKATIESEKTPWKKHHINFKKLNFVKSLTSEWFSVAVTICHYDSLKCQFKTKTLIMKCRLSKNTSRQIDVSRKINELKSVNNFNWSSSY